MRDHLRKTINAEVRSKLRPLRIMDLPDELLMRIFTYARITFYKDEFCSFERHLNFDTVADIKNLGLTCRRFCNASSHLLLQSLRVDMTKPSSLERLEEVSRHPTIRKGLDMSEMR